MLQVRSLPRLLATDAPRVRDALPTWRVTARSPLGASVATQRRKDGHVHITVTILGHVALDISTGNDTVDDADDTDGDSTAYGNGNSADLSIPFGFTPTMSPHDEPIEYE